MIILNQKGAVSPKLESEPRKRVGPVGLPVTASGLGPSTPARSSKRWPSRPDLPQANY